MADRAVAVTPGSGQSIHTVPRTLADATTADTTAIIDAGLNGTFKVTSVTVTTAATLLPTSALADRKTLFVENHGSVTVYLGGSGVVAGNGTGLKLVPGKGRGLPMAAGSAVYGRVASGTCVVAVAEGS